MAMTIKLAVGKDGLPPLFKLEIHNDVVVHSARGGKLITDSTYLW